MTRFLVMALFCLLILPTARSEYRVYQYMIKSKFPMPQDQKPYMVTSTLHPQGYLAYHGGTEALKIDLIRTWTCKGYTGNKKELCPSPTSLLKPKEENN